MSNTALHPRSAVENQLEPSTEFVRGYSREDDEWIHEDDIHADEAVTLYNELRAERDKPKSAEAKPVARLVERRPSRRGASCLCALEEDHGPADYVWLRPGMVSNFSVLELPV